MSNQLLAKWHAYMDKPSEAALSDMLHDDVTFVSPVVFTPQKGKAVAIKYLLSAGIVFQDTKFKYVHELETGNRMILEFEAEMDGKYINGVDIIDFNDEGLITQFKVMVRPLQAVNMLWQQMGAQLEKASAYPPPNPAIRGVQACLSR
ncbi:MAG: nuclear transport factor 2 family protein [PS1 clade bacterium]|nr:nuclear transport factor 2 family protein [PS1 clade bacterium]